MLKVRAILEETYEYVPPCIVDPNNKNKYICSECLKPVIFRNCSVRKKHFAHKSEYSKCNGVGSSESDTHKFAKKQVKNWLEQGYTLLIDHGGKKDAVYLSGNQQVFLEKGDKNYRADIMIKENDKVICIIEVTYTSPTVTPRPCKWYDIDALNIEDPVSIDIDERVVEIKGKVGKILDKTYDEDPVSIDVEIKDKMELTCEEEERIEWSDYAGESVEKCKRFKINNIGYICSIPCMDCKKKFYYPIYSKKRKCFLNLCAYGCKKYPYGISEMNGSLYNTSKTNEVKLKITREYYCTLFCDFCKGSSGHRIIDKMFMDGRYEKYGSHGIIKVRPYYRPCEI